MSANVKITYIKNDPAGKDTKQKLNEEWVCIENLGDTDINLSNWMLTDWRPGQQHIHKYTIPSHLFDFSTWVLSPGEILFIMTGSGKDAYVPKTSEYKAQFHLYQNSSQFIWNNTGDTACLFDASGNLISQHSV